MKTSKSQKTVADVAVTAAAAAKPGKGLRRGGLSHAQLVAQATTFARLARDHAKALEARGWTPSHTADLEQAVRAFGEAATKTQENVNTRKATTAALLQALRATRQFRQQLVAALRLASLQTGAPLDKGLLRLRQTTPAAMHAWLDRIRSVVSAMGPSLTPSFPEGAASALRRQQALLFEEIGRQRVSLRKRASSGLSLKQARSRVVAAIDGLCLVARIAFVGEPLLLAEFRKEVKGRKAPRLPAADAANEPAGAAAREPAA
jgi:hypothetical protein